MCKLLVTAMFHLPSPVPVYGSTLLLFAIITKSSKLAVTTC